MISAMGIPLLESTDTHTPVTVFTMDAKSFAWIYSFPPQKEPCLLGIL